MRTSLLSGAMGLFALAEAAVDLNHQYPMEQCGYWYQADGWDQYKEKRDNCQWGEKVPAEEFFGSSFHTGSTWDGRPVRYTWTTPLEQQIYVQECTFMDPDPKRQGEFWTLRRFGPFYSDGTRDGGKTFWQQTKWHERMTKRYLTGRSFGRYDAKTGELMGSPPIHIHHEHVGYTEGLPDFVPLLSSFKVNRLAASHGEQYGFGKDGVLFNVFKQLPHGLGKPMSYYTYDNKLADTRDDDSTPMEWFQEVGFRTTAEKRRTVYHMTRFNAGSFFKNIQVDVPTDSPAMYWTTWKMPADGEFITNWIHTHGLEEIIIFKGDPKKFGLTDKYSKPDIWSMKKIASVAAVKADLESAASAAGIDKCEGVPQFEDVMDFPEHTRTTHHTRITKICCLPWSFKKGDVVAMVGLFDGRKPNVAKRQHFLFRGEYFLDKDAEMAMGEDEKEALLMQNLQFCGEDPDTCVKTVSLGIKLSGILFYGGNMPMDTWFGRWAGWAALVVIMSTAVTCLFCGCRWGLRKAGCLPLRCFSREVKYAIIEQAEALLPSNSERSLVTV